MEANRGAGSPSNSQVEGTNGTLELEREKIRLRQMEIQLRLAELNAHSEARAGRAERDPEIERGEALQHYSKMLHGAIPKFPHDAEVPVWFETVECLFQRCAVPVEIQAHLLYPLIATRLAYYLCASMTDGEFTFEHLGRFAHLAAAAAASGQEGFFCHVTSSLGTMKYLASLPNGGEIRIASSTKA
ncbi:hypothetical protein HPB47_001500 [Ixodes persulcatus]|uniref:Uncharacterized protein n=1 Tax=Ixodes persulcatus TaxID=34615 RepID=A0AC60PQC3_IXOPE|nr:hypothetical protein HPB47_001500 [Ixodes persulcatus]